MANTNRCGRMKNLISTLPELKTVPDTEAVIDSPDKTGSFSGKA